MYGQCRTLSESSRRCFWQQCRALSETSRRCFWQQIGPIRRSRDRLVRETALDQSISVVEIFLRWGRLVKTFASIKQALSNAAIHRTWNPFGLSALFSATSYHRRLHFLWAEPPHAQSEPRPTLHPVSARNSLHTPGAHVLTQGRHC